MSEYIPIDNAILHKSESGVREFEADGTPETYAYELARYISCPSTIRARVMDRFERSPPLEAIKALQETHRADRGQFRAASDKLEATPGDYFDFEVRRLGKWPFETDRSSKVPQFPVPVKIIAGALPSDIIQSVASAFGVDHNDIMTGRRVRPVVLARRTAAYILHKRGNSPSRVAKLLRIRCRTTITYAIEQFEARATDEMRRVAAAILEARG